MEQADLLINPSEFYFVKPTSPYTGEARTEREIASQTINVSQTRITSEARGRKCVAFRRRFRKKSGITYHFSLLTRHKVALWEGSAISKQA